MNQNSEEITPNADITTDRAVIRNRQYAEDTLLGK